MIVATGTCNKCCKPLFEEVQQNLVLTKSKSEFQVFVRQTRLKIYLIASIYTVVLIVLISYCVIALCGIFVKNVLAFLPLLNIFLLMYGIMIFEQRQCQKHGFVCPSCKTPLWGGRSTISIKTNACSQCGNRLFEI